MARAGGARSIAQADFTPHALAAQIATIAGDPQAHPDLSDAYQALTAEVLDTLEVKR